ncbi:class I SAM-dependent methyltransferase [Vibrio sp. HN007]|uniref:class I SAM-dependent methyltransferase n=1 Tax=Vibrio iocasae TaxID=3098914 RepID=UPI0035D527B4
MKKEISKSDVVNANKEFYNLEAKEYLENEYYAYTNNIQADVLNNLHYSVSNSEGNEQFLDLACGSGFLSKLVSRNDLLQKGTGIDISEEQVALFNSEVKSPKFIAKVGDVTKLDFEDNSIDVVAGYSVLHHFFDYYEVLKEVTRVVKKGGVIYFDFEPNRKFQNKLSKLIKLRRKLFDTKTEKNSLHELEDIAEYHNNFEPGIDVEELSKFLQKDYEILKISKRIPEHNWVMSKTLDILSNFSFTYSPNFYIIAKKK